ncbi:MAG: HD family phosphohydrolase [Bacillota bacterium]
MTKEKKRDIHSNFRVYFKDKHIQRILIAALTIILAFIIVLNGATPKKYRLKLGEKSQFDITASREITNTVKTQQNAIKAAKEVPPDMKEIRNASIEVLSSVDSFLSLIESVRKNIDKSIKSAGLSPGDSNYNQVAAGEQKKAAVLLSNNIKDLGISLSEEQVLYLVSKASDDDIQSFESVMKDMVSNMMKKDITEENLSQRIVELQKSIQDTDLKQELKIVGVMVSNSILKPNRTINVETTEIKREIAYNDPKNIEKIKKGQRILSVGDVVTEDKLKVLEDLNLLETKSKFDYALAGGILVVLGMLSLLLILYMNNFCKKVFYNRNDLILLSIVILLTLLIARVVYEYSTLAIPIFIATMLISILLDVRLALVVNFILAIAISLMTNSETKFIYMAIISGAFSAFVVSKANQRNKLSLAGAVIAVLNVLVMVSIDIVYKFGIETMIIDGVIVFFNGLISMIITIGLLPFLESTFNIITPLRLLELANPNQPLLRRLLTEAPGTYHHSLMVGNLAEAGTEAIGGNALLARVGAYFHDIGKLKRPNFFIENQMSDNPHDKMTANLSALVITSHVQDGAEMAKRYKVPLAIRDIIVQHHGTTLVAYFYHKAKKTEKGEAVVDEANFRYDGVKPASKESAVVMLADSVEAAVRSMTDKTEGKIEGLIRKIIKDKLDDGQLDQCNLTLKDLDNIAKAFMKVFSGFFHAREEYPDVKRVANKLKEDNTEYKTAAAIDAAGSLKTAVQDAVTETSEEIAAGYEKSSIKGEK